MSLSKSSSIKYRRNTFRRQPTGAEIDFQRKDILRQCRDFLIHEKQRNGMSVSVLRNTTYEPFFESDSIGEQTQLHIVTNKYATSEKILSDIFKGGAKNKKYIKLRNASTIILPDIAAFCNDIQKRVLFLSHDKEASLSVISYFKKNSVLLTEVVPGKSLGRKKNHSYNMIMSVVDYLLSRDLGEIRYDVVVVIDGHLCSPPYRALNALAPHLIAKEKARVILFQKRFSNDVVDVIPPHKRLISMDPATWTDSNNRRVLASIRMEANLFIYASGSRCILACEKLRDMEFPFVYVMNNSTFSQVQLYAMAVKQGPCALIISGWPERLFDVKFDNVYDEGFHFELSWQDKFVEVPKSIYTSEYLYRKTLGDVYQCGIDKNRLRGKIDSDNPLHMMDVRALLMLNGKRLITSHSSGIELMLTGRSSNALMTYLSTCLPAPIFFSYIDIEGRAEDSYSDGLSLFLTMPSVSIESSGTIKDPVSYSKWRRVLNVESYIRHYEGLAKVPCDSDVLILTSAMLLINSQTHPSIYHGVREIEMSESLSESNNNGANDDVAVQQSLSTPVRSVSVVKPPRVESMSAVRESVDRKATVSSLLESYGVPKSPVTSDNVDTDSESVFSMDSKYSFKRYKRGSLSRKFKDMKHDSIGRISSSITALRKIEKSMDHAPSESSCGEGLLPLKPSTSSSSTSNVTSKIRNSFKAMRSESSCRLEFGEFQNFQGGHAVTRSTMPLSQIPHNALITPMIYGLKGFSIQDRPSSDDIFMLSKFIELIQSKGRVPVSLNTQKRLLLAFCRCWNCMVCGSHISKSCLSPIHRARLMISGGVSRIERTMNVGKFHLLVQEYPFHDMFVRVTSTNVSTA